MRELVTFVLIYMENNSRKSLYLTYIYQLAYHNRILSLGINSFKILKKAFYMYKVDHPCRSGKKYFSEKALTKGLQIPYLTGVFLP